MGLPVNLSGFPQGAIYGTSGLPFKWTWPDPQNADSSLGPDGCSATMQMLINWIDLPVAVFFLLPVTIRSGAWPPVWPPSSRSASKLQRNQAWPHPYFNWLVVKRISSVKGLQSAGQSLTNAVDFGMPRSGNSQGPGTYMNIGPWAEFSFALLTLEFWKPPYPQLSDAAVTDANGFQREWLRYMDQQYAVDSQILSREKSALVWTNAALTPGFTGSAGQVVSHLHITRRWYDIPATAIFNASPISSADGLPYNMLYTRTPTTNPITRGIGSGGNFTYAAGSPIIGCVNSPISSDGSNITDPATADNDPNSRFFNCPMGTLRLDGVEFIPQPLQMPPALLFIPAIANNEAASQVRYDVVFHFDYFDPVQGGGETFRGHNLFPFPGNGLWYSARFQQDANNTTTGPFTTPFNYADFSDLFKIQ